MIYYRILEIIYYYGYLKWVSLLIFKTRNKATANFSSARYINNNESKNNTLYTLSLAKVWYKEYQKG